MSIRESCSINLQKLSLFCDKESENYLECCEDEKCSDVERTKHPWMFQRCCNVFFSHENWKIRSENFFLKFLSIFLVKRRTFFNNETKNNLRIFTLRIIKLCVMVSACKLDGTYFYLAAMFFRKKP